MSWTDYQDDRAASYASGMIEQYHMQFDYMRSTIHGLLKPLGKAAVAVFCTPVWLAQHNVSMSYHDYPQSVLSFCIYCFARACINGQSLLLDHAPCTSKASATLCPWLTCSTTSLPQYVVRLPVLLLSYVQSARLTSVLLPLCVCVCVPEL